MSKLPAVADNLPTDPRTGLTLPLSKSLGSQDLAKHRAMVAIELEVLAKKMDRFGWERDRGSAIHDRLVTDWMDALQDFTLSEVRAACAAAVIANPNKMPNEGHVREQIMIERKRLVALRKAAAPRRDEEHDRTPCSREAAAEILAQAGFSARKFGAAQ